MYFNYIPTEPGFKNLMSLTTKRNDFARNLNDQLLAININTVPLLKKGSGKEGTAQSELRRALGARFTNSRWTSLPMDPCKVLYHRRMGLTMSSLGEHQRRTPSAALLMTYHTPDWEPRPAGPTQRHGQESSGLHRRPGIILSSATAWERRPHLKENKVQPHGVSEGIVVPVRSNEPKRNAWAPGPPPTAWENSSIWLTRNRIGREMVRRRIQSTRSLRTVGLKWDHKCEQAVKTIQCCVRCRRQVFQCSGWRSPATRPRILEGDVEMRPAEVIRSYTQVSDRGRIYPVSLQTKHHHRDLRHEKEE